MRGVAAALEDGVWGLGSQSFSCLRGVSSRPLNTHLGMGMRLMLKYIFSHLPAVDESFLLHHNSKSLCSPVLFPVSPTSLHQRLQVLLHQIYSLTSKTMSWFSKPKKSAEERLADNIRLVGPDIAAVCSIQRFANTYSRPTS